MVQLYPNKYNFEDVDYAAMNSYMTFLVNRFAPMKVEELLRDYAEEYSYLIDVTSSLFEEIGDVFDDLDILPFNVEDIHRFLIKARAKR